MKSIIERIKQQQKAMGYTDLINISIEKRLEYIRNVTLALMKETTEFLDELPWKPWKSIFDQKLDQKSAIKEITDIIVFAIVLAISTDPEADLEAVLQLTLDKIDNRILTGYGQQTGVKNDSY